MSESLIVIIVLVALLVWREAMHYIQVQKLINKLMSRNYHEYETAMGYNKPKEKEKPVVEDDAFLDEEIGVLKDYTG